MAKVGESAHTPHGLGTITEIDKQRGTTLFRVAGTGFNVWITEKALHVAKNPWGASYDLQSTVDPGIREVNDDNSTVLPYDPTPQHHVDVFRHDQNIQPGEFEIDRDKRLHPSDSLSGDGTGANRPYPGPNPDLFARGASYDHRYAEFEDAPSRPQWGEDDWHDGLPEGPERTFDARSHEDPYAMAWDSGHGRHEAPEGPQHAAPATHQVPMDDAEFQSYADLAPEPYSGGHHETYDTGYPEDTAGFLGEMGGQLPITHPNLQERGFERPAGLSARYAHIEPEVDHDNPIVAFRRDPGSFIEARGYLDSSAADLDGLEAKYGGHVQLIDADFSMKYGAWSDVRTKAMRLRHEGRVHINDIASDRIYATVEGDNGTYDTMIVKGGAMGGWGGGQSITNWHCGCEWGNWAFKRRFSYVGRLCSHAYAAYLDMQAKYLQENPSNFRTKKYNPGGASFAFASRTAGAVEDYKRWLKDNNCGPEPATIADFVHTQDNDLEPDEIESLYDYIHDHPAMVPERNFDVGYTHDPEKVYKKKSDLLLQQPQRLQPNLQQVPRDAEGRWVDVTKDERETTGPEQIVHFSGLPSNVVAALHTAAPDDPGGLNDSSGGGGPQAAPLAGTPSLPAGIGGPTSPWGHLMNDAGGWFSKTPIGETFGGGGATQQPATPPPGSPGSAGNPVTPMNTPTPGSDPGHGSFGGVFSPDSPYAGKTGQPPAAGATPPMHVQDVGAGTGAQAPAGAKPSQPTWFPQQESTTTSPTGPWTENQNKSSLTGNEYTVQKGDTLSDIANRAGLGGNYQDLAKSNQISDPNMIMPGQKIKLPGAGGGGGSSAIGDKAVTDVGKSLSMPAAGVPSATGSGDKTTTPGFTAPQPPAAPTAPKPPAPTNTPGMPAPTQSNLVKSVTPQGPKQGRRRYAEDDPKTRPDVADASGDLQRLRELSDDSPDEHYQHMREHNEEIADLCDDLEDAGVGASQFVAALHWAAEDEDEDPNSGKANFLGLSSPDWADEPFAGSGPDPKRWVSDSASYVDAHERPDFVDLTDADGDIVKYNDSRSKPQQGPRSAAQHYGLDGTLGDWGGSPDPGLSMSEGTNANADPNLSAAPGGMGYGLGAEGPLPRSVTTSLHYAEDDDTGYFNPDNADEGDWDAGSGHGFVDQLKQTADQAKGSMPNMPGMSGGGGEAAGEAGGGEAAGGAAAAEEAAPMLLAASKSDFSLDAFDRGEFASVGWDSGGGNADYQGELRRASRLGHGATQEIRVDPGFRGHAKKDEVYGSLPEDFGDNGEPTLADYGEPAASPMGSDIVAQFHRSGAAQSIYTGGTPEPGGRDDFAASPFVQSMLRTAGRKYTPDEQRELEAEYHPHGARNMPTEADLAGTHYLLGL